MRRARGAATVLVLAIMATAACERTPVDPLDDPDLAALAGTEGLRPSSLTLPGLLYSAIRRVHGEQGIEAARDLVRDLARIQHRLDAAAVDERPGLRRELRNEQLRIVLLVHDSDVVARTIRGVSEDAASLRSRRDALAGSGIAAPEASALLDDLPELLARARSALNPIDALDAATRAASLTTRVRDAIAGAARLPSLHDLFDDASSRLGAGVEHHLVTRSRELTAVAHDAVRSGDREHAHSASKAARDAQIRVVLAGLGPDAVADVIGWGQHRMREQKQTLGGAAAVRDVSRLERMNASAGNMLERADVQLRRGNSSSALDLAAHAVDLLNALEATLTGY
jgi:hypothetical protein